MSHMRSFYSSVNSVQISVDTFIKTMIHKSHIIKINLKKRSVHHMIQ